MPCNPCKCICGSYIFPQRYVLVIFISLAIILAYGQRVNISMVIAEMGSKPPRDNSSVQCNKDRKSADDDQASETGWTQEQQGILLSGFFVGYMIMQVPAGILGDYFGGRWMLIIALAISSVLTVLFPLTVDLLPYEAVVTSRVIVGLAQAGLFPNVTTLMARWVPPHERASIGGITFAAGSLGIILGQLISGLVYVMLGDDWRWVFYIWGIIGLVWCGLAFIYMYSGPDTHPFISDKELGDLKEWIIPREEGLRLNVLRMLIDPAVWALIMGQFGHDYLLFFLATSMPKFYSDVHNMEMKDNMWASSIPYTFMWFSSSISGLIADKIIKKGANVAVIRKVYTTIASVIPSICLLMIPYVECHSTLVIGLVCISLLTMGPFFSGLKVNVMDICHNYAGLLMAVVNGLGALSGVMNPPIIGYVATQNTFAQWKIIMWLMFTIASVTNVIYVIWAVASRRVWDMNDEEVKEYKEEKAKKKAEKKAAKEAKKAAKANK